MIFGKSTNEFKVGVFVLIGLVLLFMFVMLIGDLKNMGSAYKLNFTFSFINGIKIGAPVRYAGREPNRLEPETAGPFEHGVKLHTPNARWKKK